MLTESNTVLLKKYIYICKADRKGHKVIAQRLRLGQVEAGTRELFMGFLCGWQRTKYLGPPALERGQDQKWNSWNLNLGPCGCRTA